MLQLVDIQYARFCYIWITWYTLVALKKNILVKTRCCVFLLNTMGIGYSELWGKTIDNERWREVRMQDVSIKVFYIIENMW